MYFVCFAIIAIILWIIILLLQKDKKIQKDFRQFFLNQKTLELYSIEYNSKIKEFQVKNCTNNRIILQASYDSCLAYVNKINLIKIGNEEGELKR